MKPSDTAFMRAALALARRGLGRTAPNPTVAALVVDERVKPSVILGRGITAPGGRPHAEAVALAQAGERASGATIFVTLEPCAARSTPAFGASCTQRILASGIARVVIAAPDPSVHATGKGVEHLRAAGIEVVEGLLSEEAEALNVGHIRRVQTGLPFTFLKLAQTADGFAGTAERRALSITGEAAQLYVHRLRASADAILTGIGTVLADDPRLDCRLPGMEDRSPLRVVLDTSGRMPAHARMLETAARTPVIIATAEPARVLERFGARAGVEVLPVPRGSGGQLDLGAVQAALGARGITRLMVEAGPTLADALAREQRLDEVILLTGASSVGQGLPAQGEHLTRCLTHARLAQTQVLGTDTLQRFEVR